MVFNLLTKIYHLESILNTCYKFLDRAYIYLDAKKKNEIIVRLKLKKKSSKKALLNLQNEFMNELLYNALRYHISNNNRKIREYIIGRAVYSAVPGLDTLSAEKVLNFEEDPLGIAVPWEEKHGKNKKNSV